MSKFLLTASSLAMLAGPASALTAPELWESWQATMAKFGTTLTAESADYSGGTLLLKGLTAVADLGEAQNSTAYGDITLIDQDDGSVRIEVPAEITQSSVLEIEGERIETTVLVKTEGLDAIVRQDGDDRIYDVDAALFSYEFEDLSGGGGDGPVTVSMAVSDYTSTSTFGGDDTYAASFAGAFALNGAFEGRESGTFSYEATGVEGSMEGTIPDAILQPDLTNFADLGLTYDVTMSHSGSSTSINAQTFDGPFILDGTSGGGSISTGVSTENISYSITSSDISLTLQPPGFPLPIAASAAEISNAIDFPIAESPDPQSYSVSLSLQEVAVDDALWALFDPTGQLPRDPATATVEYTGEAIVLGNLLDPETMADLGGGPPLKPTTLSMRSLLLSAAGAELRGTGDLEWEDLELNPIPLGEVSLELDGGFALLDKLVALGFVPPQQVAIVRGMAGAVAETVGDDQLRSNLEFTPNGILANGVPLPF